MTEDQQKQFLKKQADLWISLNRWAAKDPEIARIQSHALALITDVLRVDQTQTWFDRLRSYLDLTDPDQDQLADVLESEFKQAAIERTFLEGDIRRVGRMLQDSRRRGDIAEGPAHQVANAWHRYKDCYAEFEDLEPGPDDYCSEMRQELDTALDRLETVLNPQEKRAAS